MLQDCGTAGHNPAECGTLGKHGLPKNQTNVILLVLRVAITNAMITKHITHNNVWGTHTTRVSLYRSITEQERCHKHPVSLFDCCREHS